MTHKRAISATSLRHAAMLVWASLLLGGCGNSANSPSGPEVPAANPQPLAAVDQQLQQIAQRESLDGNPLAGKPRVSPQEPLAQLGKTLFFSTSLSGHMQVACATCHHPLLGGGDGLSLPVGVGALDPGLLGPGRMDSDRIPDLARHSPSLFNVSLLERLFWDSSLEPVGSGPALSTAETGPGQPDLQAGDDLLAAQARFPVVGIDEMRGNFQPSAGNQTLRDHIASRIGGYGAGASELPDNNWISEFQSALNSSQDATQLIRFDSIAMALSQYQKSLVFIDNPWYRYIRGDLNALTDQQKQGALLFYSRVEEGGAGCFVCHSGNLLTDQQHHRVGFPQMGVGLARAGEDPGRAAVTAQDSDRFAFRTPSLLNLEVTSPYGHAGTYATLEQVVDHYSNPTRAVRNFLDNAAWCELPQFRGITADCANIFPGASQASAAAIAALNADRLAGASLFSNANLSASEQAQLVAFLRALTDPCTQDRHCLASWLPESGNSGPDGNQLQARFRNLP